MLPNGCILILESSPDSILLNPRSGLITRNLLSSQILPDVIEIAAAGEYIALATTIGAVLLYNLVGQEIKFIKNIYLPSGQNDLSVINLGLSFIDEKLFIHRLVSKNLENLVIIVDIMNSDRSISQETHVITGNYACLEFGLVINCFLRYEFGTFDHDRSNRRPSRLHCG